MLLAERRIKTDGALDWPTAEQFKNTDVVVCYAEEAGNANPEQRANLEEFTKRGGGIVVIHSAAVATDHDWWKSIIGGSWVKGTTKWREGPMDLYYTDNQHLGTPPPDHGRAHRTFTSTTRLAGHAFKPDVHVLATSYYAERRPRAKRSPRACAPNIYDIQPQMWACEKQVDGRLNYRAFVSDSRAFVVPDVRAAVLSRDPAAAASPGPAKRANIDEFCKPEEISRRCAYPEGRSVRSRRGRTRAARDSIRRSSMTLVASRNR